jgi:hypothetical protein
MTTNEAKKDAVKRLQAAGITFSKVTARTVSFGDLARASERRRILRGITTNMKPTNRAIAEAARRYQIIAVPTEEGSREAAAGITAYWFIYDTETRQAWECESYTDACERRAYYNKNLATDLAPDGLPWITREPNRQTPHAENGWQYHYPIN